MARDGRGESVAIAVALTGESRGSLAENSAAQPQKRPVFACRRASIPRAKTAGARRMRCVTSVATRRTRQRGPPPDEPFEEPTSASQSVTARGSRTRSRSRCALERGTKLPAQSGARRSSTPSMSSPSLRVAEAMELRATSMRDAPRARPEPPQLRAARRRRRAAIDARGLGLDRERLDLAVEPVDPEAAARIADVDLRGRHRHRSASPRRTPDSGRRRHGSVAAPEIPRCPAARGARRPLAAAASRLSDDVVARQARVRRVARLVARVGGLARSIAAGMAHEQVLRVDELVARIVRDRVDARVHADGIAGAGLDAEAAEDAAELVDDELHRVALVAAALVALGVLARLDVDALRRARRRAAEARDATRARVVAEREAMQPRKRSGYGRFCSG